MKLVMNPLEAHEGLISEILSSTTITDAYIDAREVFEDLWRSFKEYVIITDSTAELNKEKSLYRLPKYLLERL